MSNGLVITRRLPARQLVKVRPRFAFGLSSRVRWLVETIHDGDAIPAELVGRAGFCDLFEEQQLSRDHWAERDWGADLVAGELAAELGCGGFQRVPIARVLLDVGRFAGVARAGDDHLTRRAVGAVAAAKLDTADRELLLAGYYDPVWRRQRAACRGLLAPGEPSTTLRIGIHTYDPVGRDGRRRPQLSLLNRADGSVARAPSDPLAPGIFDRLIPAAVGHATADPARCRAVVDLLQADGFEVTANDPYELPLGSVEVRLAVWQFLTELRRDHARCSGTAAARRVTREVWPRLSDLTLRRPVDDVPEPLAASTGKRYEELVALAGDVHRGGPVSFPKQLQTFAFEVRKDLVWDHARGPGDGPLREPAQAIARSLAAALRSAFG